MEIVPKDQIPERFQFTVNLTDHPIVKDPEGVLRFQESPIVKWLRDQVSVNDMWRECGRGTFSTDELMQFYRDIGYSLGGFEEVWGEILDQKEKEI